MNIISLAIILSVLACIQVFGATAEETCSSCFDKSAVTKEAADAAAKVRIIKFVLTLTLIIYVFNLLINNNSFSLLLNY